MSNKRQYTIYCRTLLVSWVPNSADLYWARLRKKKSVFIVKKATQNYEDFFFVICNSTFSKLRKNMYTAACRRVLTSTPLELIGSRRLVAFGNKIYKLNLIQGASIIMRKAFDWKRSRISMWKWKPYPRVVFRKSRLVWVLFYTWEMCLRFDFRQSNQYILVRVIPSCFCFAKMCLCQVSLQSRCSPRFLTSSSWGSCKLFIWTGGHVSLHVMNVTWIDLYSLAFILHF
jgi:hypothetical protein